MSTEQLMRDALATIHSLKARVADLEKQLSATESELTKARGGTTETATDLQKGITASLKAAKPNTSAAGLIPGMLAANKDRRALADLSPTDRLNEVAKRREASS